MTAPDILPLNDVELDRLLAFDMTPPLSEGFTDQLVEEAQRLDRTAALVPISVPRKVRRPWVRTGMWSGIVALNLFVAVAIAATLGGGSLALQQLVDRAAHVLHLAHVHNVQPPIIVRQVLTRPLANEMPIVHPIAADHLVAHPLPIRQMAMHAPMIERPTHRPPHRLEPSHLAHRVERKPMTVQREQLLLHRDQIAHPMRQDRTDTADRPKTTDRGNMLRRDFDRPGEAARDDADEGQRLDDRQRSGDGQRTGDGRLPANRQGLGERRLDQDGGRPFGQRWRERQLERQRQGLGHQGPGFQRQGQGQKEHPLRGWRRGRWGARRKL